MYDTSRPWIRVRVHVRSRLEHGHEILRILDSDTVRSDTHISDNRGYEFGLEHAFGHDFAQMESELHSRIPGIDRFELMRGCDILLFGMPRHYTIKNLLRSLKIKTLRGSSFEET